MDHTVGYVLLGAAAVPAFLGFLLAQGGFRRASQAVEKAAQTVNASDADAAQKGMVSDAVGGVGDALKQLTGVFAPARVFLSLALVLVVAALLALDVFSVTAEGGGTTTTTVTTTTTP